MTVRSDNNPGDILLDDIPNGIIIDTKITVWQIAWNGFTGEVHSLGFNRHLSERFQELFTNMGDKDIVSKEIIRKLAAYLARYICWIFPSTRISGEQWERNISVSKTGVPIW
uniref:Uncharacterized protein n=1 Tax=Candidatus Kentrum sp. FW TaxID=2126338 RepID=A0A450SY48_9GAMM|nr:MAG: hypothetical protein BECKFW1821A_GA0114235_10879 [Candidatus Kentron sp. FW]